jgi:hypothetical protein
MPLIVNLFFLTLIVIFLYLIFKTTSHLIGPEIDEFFKNYRGDQDKK